ncbi:MAG: protein phosphatase 2C domain-containing protein [Muribaculaceae bacterium]|nr:protein phosphatase 2C domain-containing protein [Muribaculaceae bacterium]
MSMTLKYKAVSNVGSVRTNNEDMGYANGKLVRDIVTEGECAPPSAFAVADGMGGYEGGEIASEITVRSFAQALPEIFGLTSEDEVIAALKRWAKETNRLVLDTGSLREGLQDMGTTFVALVSLGGKLFLINIGDSRCYRLRGDVLKQLSTDHSERERTGDENVASNIIYNYLGNSPSDFFSDVTVLTPLAGDSYLLCSDGLSDLLTEDEIEANFLDPTRLVDMALEAGGRDNVTAITVDVS